MTHSFPTRRSSDLQPANARQGRDDVLDHAVDEVVLRGFSTQIQEWHNGEGWFFGKRWRMGRRVPDRGSRTIWGSASGRRPLFPDVADEAERSEERRVGKEWVGTGRSRGGQAPKKKN